MSFLRRQIEGPGGLKRLKVAGIVLLAVVLVSEVVLPLIFGGGHHHFGFESLPAFGSIYGLVSCVVIIVGSKAIGKLGLMRPEEPDDD